jgi:glycosyltransferase involved in cell wall biosynthesis
VKIVHLLSALTKGGAERVAVDLAIAAASVGHEVTVVAGWEVDRHLLADRLGSDVDLKFISASSNTIRRYFDGLRWVVRSWNWLSQQDVIHCHLTYGAALGTSIRLIRRWKRGRRPAVVETYHAVGMPMPPLHRYVASKLAAYRDGLALMAEDPYWNKFQETHPRLLTRTILNGVSAPRAVTRQERAKYRKQVGIPDRARFVVGTIGALRPERRTHAFVPAFEEIARKLGPDVHFLIGGDGPARPILEEAIRASSVADRVHLPGLVEEPALLLAQLDLYLTLNVGSTTGIAALEAAMAGVPILALQLLPGHISTKGDWIWSTTDPVALGSRAAAVLSDPSALRMIAKAQRAQANSHHSVGVMAAHYQAFYESALARTRP